MGQLKLPGQDKESEASPVSIEDWGSLNTKANRPAIQPNEFSWVENWMPIGKGNLRTLYAEGSAIYTAPGILTIISHYHYNLGSTQYAAVFLSDGSAVQVNESSGATVTIGAAGTFYSGGDLPACTQWQSQYLLIGSSVSANAYWIWDGTSLYGAGTLAPQITVSNGGRNYTSAPTVTARGGSGSGATFTATVTNGAVTTVTVNNPGSGYLQSDHVQLTFSGGGSDTQAYATATVNSAAAGVVAINVTNGGSGYSSDVKVTFTGGGGSGAAAVVSTAVNGVIISITVTNGGSGYTTAPTIGFTATTGSGATAVAQIVRGQITGFTIVSGGSGYTGAPQVVLAAPDGWDFPTIQATATATVSGGVVTAITVVNPGAGYQNCGVQLLGGNNAANATCTLMPFGLQATSIETYNSQVWTSANAKMTFSAPASVSDFSTLDGGGSASVNAAYLRQKIIRLIQANGFLYRLGDSSIDVISNVQTSSTGTTTFNTSNVDAQIGTAWRDSVAPFGRAIVFANPNGVYALYGGAAEKVSDALDGLFADASFNTGQTGVTPTAAVATMFGIRVYMLLFTTTDPFGVYRNIVAVWDGQKWFCASQLAVLKNIALEEINSVLTAWGTDGTHLYRMFQTASNSLTKTFQTKLTQVSGYHAYKQVNRGYVVAENNTGTGQPLNLAIDSESSVGNTVASPLVASSISFLGAGGVPITFVGSGAINFTISGLGIVGFQTFNYGRMLGWTCTTTADDIVVMSLAMLLRDYAPYA